MQDEIVQVRATRRRNLMAAYWVLVGAAVGAAYVLLTGILTIQIAGVLGGAVINLNNEVVAVRPPGIPYLQWLASAVLSALTFYVVAVRLRARAARVRVAAGVGFVVSTLALFAWSLSIKGEEAPGTHVAGTALGWQGWIQEGGPSPAVHLLIVLTLGAVLTFSLRPSSFRPVERPEAANDRTDFSS